MYTRACVHALGALRACVVCVRARACVRVRACVCECRYRCMFCVRVLSASVCMRSCECGWQSFDMDREVCISI
jgi:hypothetical protein